MPVDDVDALFARYRAAVSDLTAAAEAATALERRVSLAQALGEERRVDALFPQALAAATRATALAEHGQRLRRDLLEAAVAARRVDLVEVLRAPGAS